MSGQGASPIDVSQLYNAIKAQEPNFPVPQPTATIAVGTFNAQTREFKYAVKTYTERVGDPATQNPTKGGPLKPQIETLTGGQALAVNVFDLKLRFDVTGQKGTFTVNVPGHKSGTAPQGQSSVVVDVGAATEVNFTLICDGNSFTPELPLKIDRPAIAAGAMTIPAWPVAIVYAPPVDAQKKNTASLSNTDSIGATTTVSFTAGHSKQAPVNAWDNPGFGTAEFQRAAPMSDAMKSLGPLLKDIPIVSSALGVISGLLGSVSGTETQGTTVTNQHSQTVTNSTQDTVTTNPNGGGPGSSDIMYFLKNARLCWFSTGGPVQLALLGWDQSEYVDVSMLKHQPGKPGLDQKTAQALLALDPFVAGGPQANLPKSRFAYVDTIDVNGVMVLKNISYTLSNTDLQQTADTIVDVENDSQGLLGFLGVMGLPDTQTLQTTMSQSSALQTTQTHSVSKQLQLNAGPQEFYSVEVYCDVVFGTFAFRPIQTAASPIFSGIARGKSNEPLANTEVTLVSNGRRFVTMSDESGRFAFRASTIPAGVAQIMAGPTTANVQIPGSPISNLETPP